MTPEQVLLLGHGTVERLDDLPPFLANIRHGRPAPNELVSEMRHRYDAIGGSPLLAISHELAGKLGKELHTPVHLAMRFWHPFLSDVLDEAAQAGAEILDVVPLAPFSAEVYEVEARRAAEDNRKRGRASPELRFGPDWGSEPLLIEAFASALGDALGTLDAGARAQAHVFFTAHSLPLFVVQKGDRYPDAVQATAEAVAQRAHLENPWRLVFQSQGATADPWLGPALRESLEDAAAHGVRDVVLCPIGFLSDHVEILYDLDIEARKWADAYALRLRRTTSLNASDALVRAMAAVVRRIREGSKLGV